MNAAQLDDLFEVGAALLEGLDVVLVEQEFVLLHVPFPCPSSSCFGLGQGRGGGVDEVPDDRDEGEGLDATQDVPLDGVAIQNGVVGDAKSTLLAVIVEGDSKKTLNLGW